MPSRPCRHPGCTDYAKLPAAYCARHQAERPPKAEARRFYDQHLRDPQAKRFYNSPQWEATRRRHLAENPLCARCGKFADTVHHVKPLSELGPQRGLLAQFLQSLCAPCHSKTEAEADAHIEPNGM